MKRILFGLAVFLWLASPVAALTSYADPFAPCRMRGAIIICPSSGAISEPLRFAQFVQVTPPTPPTPAQPMPGAVGVPALIAPPAVIDTGTLAGQALTWVLAVGGGTLATILSGILVKVFQRMGVQITDALRARLQEIILNGLNAGAKAAAEQLRGRGQVEIKSAAVATTVRYVQAHGADSIKALGLDPTSPAAVEAIKARIETAIADPTVPTPKVLDAPAAPAAPGNPALAPKVG